ncbi:MAG: hypothetical protein KGD66_04620 [Candidatus Lokiarchaeota archaeon]|nr:hypothetical protein [Candidatus Lokiarchaeota archaeon]
MGIKNLSTEDSFEVPIIIMVKFEDYTESKVAIRVNKFELECKKDPLLRHLRPVGARYSSHEGYKQYVIVHVMQEYYEIPFSSFDEDNQDDAIYQDYHDKVNAITHSVDKLRNQIQETNIESCIRTIN